MARGIDLTRLAQATSRPGIDPRVWLTLARVTELGYDPAVGPFADVTFDPGGETETCLIGAPYAGSGFGAWFPCAVGDAVLVAVPMGDTGHGPVIVARMWTGTLPPFAEMRAAAAGSDGEPDPAANVVIRVQADKDMTIRVSGSGRVSIVPEGSGKVFIGGTDGTQPPGLGQVIKDHFDAVKSYVDGHTHLPGSFTAGGDPVLGVSGAPVSGSPTVPDPRAQKVEIK